MRKKHWYLGFFLAIALLVFSVVLTELQLLQKWDNLFYDLTSSYVKRPNDKQIVIIAIDEYSLHKIGRWPWPRAMHARLIDRLTDVGVSAIGMDILFMEPNLSNPEDDQKLVNAIRRNGRVVLPVLTHYQDQQLVVTPPLADIAKVAKLAHVNMDFDRQGIVRKLDLQLKTAESEVLPAMSLALMRLLPEYTDPLSLDSMPLRLLAFSGPFQQISYSKVLFDQDIANSLQNKLVLIGITAAGFGNEIATPVSKKGHLMTGIELQANALANMRSKQFISPVEWPLYSLLSIILIGMPVFLYSSFKPKTVILLTLGGCALTGVSSYILLSKFQLWFAPLATLTCQLLSYPLYNIRRLEQLGQLLFRQDQMARATLNVIADAVIATDNKGCIEYMNPAAEKMLSYSLSEVKQKPVTDYFPFLKQNNQFSSEHLSLVDDEKNKEMQIVCNRNQQEFKVHFSSHILNTDKGQIMGGVYVFNDLTEIIDTHQQVEYIATHDSLTELPNRVLLKDRLQQAIKAASREQQNFAVLFIDLDDFKKINDAMGHACGDLLLKEVAQRLKQCSRQSDTVCRWGGDEFILLLDKLTSQQDAADVAMKIIQSLSEAFVIEGQDAFVSPSIGISLFPTDGQQVDNLLAKADTAMYNVKSRGRNNFCFYSIAFESQSKERLLLETELRRALEYNEFELFYQPQIDIVTDQLIGVEALIRWNHPEKGLVPPVQFITQAEHNGLIVPIGEWVIQQACQQIMCWQEFDLSSFKMAINISARQFSEKNLVENIIREINKKGQKNELLQVEITENMMADNIDQVVLVLNQLKTLGVSIAVDDFGTGYSSLEYLTRLPIDKLKIDKSFIDTVLTDNDDASIVKAVISMGHNMGMKVIAEGVENKEQVKFLLQHGCDYAQGFFYSKPVNAQQITLLLERNKSSKNV